MTGDVYQYEYDRDKLYVKSYQKIGLIRSLVALRILGDYKVNEELWQWIYEEQREAFRGL
jgi:hypothetical protein